MEEVIVSFTNNQVFGGRHVIRKVIDHLRNADTDLKEVMRGSTVAFSIKILAAGSAFAMNVVIARQLGADEAGLFFLAYTIVYIVAAVSRLGLDNTFVRFIAAHHASGEYIKIKGLYLTGIRWTFTAALLFTTLVWISADFVAVAVFHKPAFAHVMHIMSLAIPPVALFTLHANALQGVKRILQSTATLGIASLALLTLTILVGTQTATSAATATTRCLCSIRTAMSSP